MIIIPGICGYFLVTSLGINDENFNINDIKSLKIASKDIILMSIIATVLIVGFIVIDIGIIYLIIAIIADLFK